MYTLRIVAGKDDRLTLISRMVRGGAAQTQGQLIRGLAARGHRVDQSTLSRDLAELGVRKLGGRYVLPPGGRQPRTPAPSDFASMVTRFAPCGPHLTIVTTVVGQAQSVGGAIDAAGEDSIAATLAGDDTLFLATKSRRAQTVALRRLKQWFGDKHEA